MIWFSNSVKNWGEILGQWAYGMSTIQLPPAF